VKNTIKNAKREGEGQAGTGSRITKPTGKGMVPGASNDESSQTINERHFGHIKKTVQKLHGSDPYIASHKL
jgi:hypothetical protein